MQSILKAGLAGAAFAAVAGFSPAFAGDGQPHILNVRMPDGSIAQIAYFGDVPPQVTMAPTVGGTPPFEVPAGYADPFVALQRISAMMDRQADLMMRQMAETQEAATAGAATNPAPVGGSVAASAPSGRPAICMRSVQITYSGTGAPQVVSHNAGDCGAVSATEPPSTVSAPPSPYAPEPKSQPHTIEVRAKGDQSILALAQPASLPR